MGRAGNMHVLLLLFYLLYTCIADDTDPTMGEGISLGIPRLSEEETQSNHMPNHLKCDACIAVAHQLHTAFTKAKSKITKIKESDVIEISEQICTTGFDEYGLKQVDGVNRLSGPGLETERVMGMTQMGGRWPYRLQEMCHYYVGEAGELDIYKVSTKSKNKLTEFLCFGKGIYSHCNHLKPSVKTEL